jgi:rhodanese-related sulfurtransferase
MFKTANLSQIDEFDEIIDVRTPAEFYEDHIPGAINCPVLSNEERITVGTLYKQISPFEARKVGATMVAKNIAEHLQTKFINHPKSWRPLIYCWRGGQRSGAMSVKDWKAATRLIATKCWTNCWTCRLNLNCELSVARPGRVKVDCSVRWLKTATRLSIWNIWQSIADRYSAVGLTTHSLRRNGSRASYCMC